METHLQNRLRGALNLLLRRSTPKPERDAAYGRIEAMIENHGETSGQELFTDSDTLSAQLRRQLADFESVIRVTHPRRELLLERKENARICAEKATLAVKLAEAQKLVRDQATTITELRNKHIANRRAQKQLEDELASLSDACQRLQDNLKQAHEERDAANQRATESVPAPPWSVEETEQLRGAYHALVTEHAGKSRARRTVALEDMINSFGDQFPRRSAKAIRRKIEMLRATNPTQPHLFPEHGKTG